MEIFRTSQRVPARYVPAVGDYDEIPSGPPGFLPATVRSVRQSPVAAGSMVTLMFMLVGLLYVGFAGSGRKPGGDAPARGPGAGSARPVLAGPASHAGQAGSDRRASSGNGRPAGSDRPGNPLQDDPDLLIRYELKRLCMNLGKAPTTSKNLEPRIQLLRRFFNSLDRAERLHIFGCAEFEQLVKAIKTNAAETPRVFDGIVKRLTVVVWAP